MSDNPIISCIMSVYADDIYLESAIQSILDQTFHNFELIIISDGATKQCKSIIKKFQSIDSRIFVINNDINFGLAYSLNLGLAHAKGEYIFRMDGDDISLRNRFETQYLHMKANPEIDILGSNIEVIDKDGKIIKKIQFPENHQEIAQRLKYNNCLAHPSIAIKLNAIEKLGGYDERLRFAQDFDLWHRAVRAGLTFGNVQENLIKYRKADTRSLNKLWSGFRIGIVYALQDRSLWTVIILLLYFCMAFAQNTFGFIKRVYSK